MEYHLCERPHIFYSGAEQLTTIIFSAGVQS